MEETVPANMSRWQKGRYAAKASWKVLKLDKELSVFAVMNILLVPIIGVLGLVAALILSPDHDLNSSASDIIGVVCLALIYLVTTYTGAAIVAGALTRFRGGDPTVHSSLAAVRRRLGSLTLFALFYGTVLQLLQLAEKRLPLIGEAFAWLANIAFSVASVFAIPVIVDSKQPVGPLQAIKESAGIIRRNWMAGAVASFSIAGVIFVVVVLEIGVAVLSLAIINHAIGVGQTVGDVVDVVIPSLMVVALVVTVIVASVLSSILKAAIYHYATTGESPAQFDKELMKQAFTTKKARNMLI